MLLGAVTAMVLAAGVAVSPASATVPSWGNQGVNENNNVPYLAWRGEHVRLGFCTAPSDTSLVPAGNYVANWAVEDWSGDPANGSIPVPYELGGTASQYGNCYYTSFTSQKAGVAFIKFGLTDPETHYQVVYHQFVVIWMDLLKPTATIIGDDDVNAGDFCDPKFDAASLVIARGGYRVCDPTIDPRHRVQVIVKGHVPLKANFWEWDLDNSLTFPDDWPVLAAKFANCTAVPNDPTCHTTADAMTNWDIHDDSLATHNGSLANNGHVLTAGTQCLLADETNPAGSQDEVDNCLLPSNDSGPFSTVFGTPTTVPTWGPYDPLFPAQTLLSDGKVDAGDAPMPAARIDVTILENNAADLHDTSGVGYLFPSYKTEVYSRDGLGSDWWGALPDPTVAHNYYAPYYSQFIPATRRDPGATGIDGAASVEGFNGFLVDGLYRNWNFGWQYSFHPNTDSKCLDQQTYLPFRQWYRPLPYGTSSVTVYTDEAGEANVNFVPGLGYYFDNLLANKNLNKGCDLDGVDPLGSATIETTAKYPYQPVTAPDQVADPVTFTVHNQFHKTLSVYSKGVDTNGIPSNSLAKIVLAHAQDIDGSPLAHEGICWMADSEAEGFRVFAGDLPAPTTEDPDAVITLDPHGALEDPWGIHRLCTFTDENGNSAIEVFNSHKTSVNVIAEFVNEGLIRDTWADFAVATVGSTTSADGPPTSHVPTQQQLNTAVAIGSSGPVVATKSAVKTIKSKQAKLTKKVLHKIRFAKVVTPFRGKAKLLVRVNGKAGMVGLRITIKKGGKLHTYTRFVPANRQITVKNLVIPAKTAKVTVKMIGL
jgi:hypothetical protein